MPDLLLVWWPVLVAIGRLLGLLRIMENRPGVVRCEPFEGIPKLTQAQTPHRRRALQPPHHFLHFFVHQSVPFVVRLPGRLSPRLPAWRRCVRGPASAAPP